MRFSETLCESAICIKTPFVSSSASSVTKSHRTFCEPVDCSTPHSPVFHYIHYLSLLRFMPIESVMPSNCLILCHLHFLLPPIFPSIRVFPNESALHIRWTRYWSFSFGINPSNEYSGLIFLGWTGWISLLSKGLSRVFSNTTVQKPLAFSFFYSPTLTSIHHHWKNYSFDCIESI